MTGARDTARDLITYLKQGTPRLKHVFTQADTTYIQLEYDDPSWETLQGDQPLRKPVPVDAFQSLEEYAEQYPVPDMVRHGLAVIARDAAAMTDHFTRFYNDLKEAEQLPNPGGDVDELVEGSVLEQVRNHCETIAFDEVREVTLGDAGEDFTAEDVENVLTYKEDVTRGNET